MRHGGRQSGFSMVEVMIALALTTAVLAAFASVYATTDGLSSETKMVVRAHEEHRRNLEALAGAFRGAGAGSFTGFTNNVSVSPSFRCVTGADANGAVLGPVNQVLWRAVDIAVPGVSNPGELVRTANGVTTVIGRCVPAGGFRVTQLGSALQISLSTYYGGAKHRVLTLHDDVVVAWRN